VPSGNFGNICAGHVARMMGLPIGQLVLATNENDVLDEFFRTGTYRVRGSAETHETSSPSMDISKASNFERFVFDLLGRDGAARTPSVRRHAGRKKAASRWRRGRVRAATRAGLRLRLGKQHPRRPAGHHPPPGSDSGVMIDTHTADGLKVAREHLRPGVPMLVLETALPAKFAATIREATGRDPERRGAAGIEKLPKRFTVMPADARP
jgi:threonine synthase